MTDSVRQGIFGRRSCVVICEVPASPGCRWSKPSAVLPALEGQQLPSEPLAGQGNAAARFVGRKEEAKKNQATGPGSH